MPGVELAVEALQVLEKDAPGNPVHRQVVDGQQQALAAVGQVDQHGTDQLGRFQGEAALGLVGEGRELSGRGQLAVPEHRAQGVGCEHLGLPGAVPLLEALAQGVVVDQQGRQCLFQARRLQGHRRAQQDGLVPVLALGMSVSKKVCWMGSRASGPVTGPWSMTWASPRRATAASSCTLWCRNRSFGVNRMPAWRARLTTWMEMMESPPSSKKLSVTPMRATLRMSCQMSAIPRSRSLRGAT